MADFVVPSLLFLLFTVFSAVGAFFITAQYRGRATAVVAALLTLFFFAALFLAVLAILPEGSLSGR